jgi:hypothetical protein
MRIVWAKELYLVKYNTVYDYQYIVLYIGQMNFKEK